MQIIIQIYPGLLKLSHKQESVTDRQTAAITISPHCYRGGIIKRTGQKPPHNEIIIQSYYIFFYNDDDIKDILKIKTHPC